MVRNFRISRKKEIQNGITNEIGLVYAVEMWHLWHWIVIKTFSDKDLSFAKREAEELLESLKGDKEIKIKLKN